MLTVGSLFSGIGGFDLGLERAGMRTVWFCEQNPYRRRVLAKHWPGVPCYSDVCALVADTERGGLAPRGAPGQIPERQRLERAGAGDGEGKPLPVLVPHVDVLCGGFPCQDLSYAGRGEGIDGARSGLWAQFARLIGELRPSYVIVENVPALLARGMGRVLGDLAACGYDAEWDCLPAAAFGAPHRRDRVWLVAYPQRESVQRRRVNRDVGGASGSERKQARPDAVDSGPTSAVAYCVYCGEPTGTEYDEHPECVERSCDEALADPEELPVGAGLRESGPGGVGWGRPGDGSGEGNPWAVEPDVGRVANGIPNRVDRLAALGDALVPQIAEWIGRRIMDFEDQRHTDVAA